MMYFKPVLKHLLHDEWGVSAVEFALVIPAFILMFLAVFGFAQLFWIQSSIEEAIIIAGRYSMINSSATSTQLKTAAQNALPGIDPTSVSFSVSTVTDAGINYTTIKGTYNFSWLSLVPGLADFSISETLNAPVPPGR